MDFFMLDREAAAGIIFLPVTFDMETLQRRQMWQKKKKKKKKRLARESFSSRRLKKKRILAARLIVKDHQKSIPLPRGTSS